MKRTLFLLVFLSLFGLPVRGEEIPTAPYLPAQSGSSAEDAPITVQFPYEKMAVSRGASKIFLFGQINLKGPVTLDINGEAIPVRNNGAFIRFYPSKAANFPSY